MVSLKVLVATFGLAAVGVCHAAAGAKVTEKVITSVLTGCSVDFSKNACVVIGRNAKGQREVINIPVKDQVRYIVNGVPVLCYGANDLRNLFIEKGKDENKDVYSTFRKFTWERKAVVKDWGLDVASADPYVKAENVYILED